MKNILFFLCAYFICATLSTVPKTKTMASTKVAVVTGGNKGIGFAIVKGLCQKFAGVVYLTARDVQRGENSVKELEKIGLHPKFHQLDVTDQSSIDKFKNYIKSNYGGIDILVNNAAIAFKNDATEPFATQAEVTIAVNYFGLLRVCNTLFSLIRPHARVVNLSSSSGLLSRIPGVNIKEKLANPNLTESELSVLMNEFVQSAKTNSNIEDGWGNSAYVVSKVGVSALTIIQQKMFDADTTKPGINVNAVHPGYVDTDMTSHKGYLTIEQGADAPLYLALLPEEEIKIKGSFVWSNREIVDWRGGNAPTIKV